MGCFTSSYAHEVQIDLENKVEATSEESKAFKECEEVLVDAKRVLAAIEEYKGCRELVRQAMSKPTKEKEQKAFEGLLEAVESISLFFEFSRSLERILPVLLDSLAPARPRDDGKHTLLAHQALARQLALVFDFTLRFDQTRMMRPNLSNDFSYYRRLLPKFSKHPDVKVKDDEASGMALFTAEHIPMMSTLAKAAKTFIDNADNSVEGVQSLLSTMANSCMRLVKGKKFAAEETNWLCLRAMTGSIVLYDHVTQQVFSKKSPIAIRECILLLKRDYAGHKDVDPLMNALHYSTVSFKTAPLSIQDLFE